MSEDPGPRPRAQERPFTGVYPHRPERTHRSAHPAEDPDLPREGLEALLIYRAHANALDRYTLPMIFALVAVTKRSRAND